MSVSVPVCVSVVCLDNIVNTYQDPHGKSKEKCPDILLHWCSRDDIYNW